LQRDISLLNTSGLLFFDAESWLFQMSAMFVPTRIRFRPIAKLVFNWFTTDDVAAELKSPPRSLDIVAGFSWGVTWGQAEFRTRLRQLISYQPPHRP
jgi:hypothetical protein